MTRSRSSTPPGLQMIGVPIRRVEDRRLVTGAGRYVDDLRLPGMVHLALLRSPHARARFRPPDLARARRAPGVVDAVTARDLGAFPPFPVMPLIPDVRVPPHPLLAAEEVLAVGVPIVAVVADDPYRARDALEAIEVEWEPLPAAPDVPAATAPGAPALHATIPDNRAFEQRWRAGDVERAFREAARSVRLEVAQSLVAAVALEPRGVLAVWDAGTETLTLWASTQTPFTLRAGLAATLGWPEHSVRVIAPEVGGAFGVKGSLYREDALAALLARRTGRPVKWVATRAEDVLTTQHGRGARMTAELALAADGTARALRARIMYPLGAHLVASATVPPARCVALAPGAYTIESVDVTATGVLTDTNSTGAYRGAGRPEGAFVVERLMDEAARALGVDPVELRRRNLVPREAFPYRSATGQVYDSGDYALTLERALALAGYAALRREQAERRAHGERVGIGVSCYVEPSAFGWESGSLRIERNGQATATTGACSSGQGHETTFAQLLADRLGMAMEDVRVVHGDTAGAAQAIGTFGSRSTALAGSALAEAAGAVVAKARRLAASLLEAAPDDVVLDGGAFGVRGAPGRRATWKDVAALAHAGGGPPAGEAPGLEATVFFLAARDTFSFGVCLALVAVDRETGLVRLERLVSVDDCGNVINPVLVEGQLHGSLAQGVGQALLEGLVYDRAGQLLTATLMDYAIPRAQDMPPLVLDRTTTPTPLNPLGAKGAGEAGTIGAPPAIVNAVIDALAPDGVTTLDMPLTAGRVWAAIRRARR